MYFVSKIWGDLRDQSYPQRLTSLPSNCHTPYSTSLITRAWNLCQAGESWSPLWLRLQL